MPDATFKLSGIGGMRANIRTAASRFRKLAMQRLYQRASEILDRAALRAPRDRGDLRDSKVIQAYPIYGSRLEVQIGFNAPYAVAVHEHLSETSPPSWQAAEAAGDRVQFHPEGTGPKFLELELAEAVGDLGGKLAGDLQL